MPMLTAVSAPLPVRAGLAGVAILAACAAAHAQFVTGFEHPPYNASPAGTVLTAQDGWQPDMAFPDDFLAYTYASNSLGLPANPTGGAQFAGAQRILNGSATRHPVDFSTGGQWTCSWDVAVRFNGTGTPTLNNLGITTLYGATTRVWSTRTLWTDTTATAWNAMFQPYDASGNQAAAPLLPGPAFGGLLANHWYRQSVTWSFDTNLMTSVSMTDLTSGVSTTVTPDGWYLAGGANPTGPMPDRVRLTVGGTIGTAFGFDNFNVTQVPTPAASLLLLTGGLALMRRPRR